MLPSPKEIKCYQLLVKKQLEYLRASHSSNVIDYLVYTFNFPNGVSIDIPKPSLGYEYKIYDIAKDQELSNYADVLQDLISKGMLIELGKIYGAPIYTTLHADVVFRVIRGRAYEDDLDGRWVGHYIIEYEESKLPNFNAVKSERLKELLVTFFKNQGIDEGKSAAVAEAIVEGLEKAGFRSLASWQYKAIESILLGAEDYYVIDAPTATGKTLAFMIPAITYALIKKLNHTHRNIDEALSSGSLLVYPRKTLQKQQLEILLKILHHINSRLSEKLNIELSVAIDKGGGEADYIKKEIAEIDLGDELRGKLVQIRHKAESSRGVQLSTFLELDNGQKISLSYFKGMVLHDYDRDYILSQKPDILITNPWTIRERIKSLKPGFSDAYIGRKFITFDEAHVYVNINYLDLIATLKFYRYIMNSEIENNKVRFVLSSATIPLKDKRELVQWILGLCRDINCSSYDIDLNKVSLLDYNELEPDNPNKVLKIVVTLLPYRLSIETLMQGIIQVLATALMHRQLKAIVFVDSISEVSTLKKYVDTIFRAREGIEVCDHILNISCRQSKDITIKNSDIRKSLDIGSNTYDDYSWSHLASTLNLVNKRVNDILDKIQKVTDIIKEHHGALNDDVRRAIEQGFVKGYYKILLATSTIDLGVNFDDVTFIIQYKEPISDEALIQRVGRAGRKDESFKISMAFYIPTYTPMLIQALLSQQVSTSSSLISPPRPLPHPAITHKLFNIERLEYNIKLKLLNHIMREESKRKSKPILLKKLLFIALSNVVHASSNEYKVAFIPLPDRENLRQLKNIIKNMRDAQKLVNEKAKLLSNTCKPRANIITSVTKIVSVYVNNWIKELMSLFDEYAELGVGLALLTRDEAKEQLEKFKQKINEWVNIRPKVNPIGDNQVIFSFPSSDIQPQAIDLRKVPNDRTCRDNIKAFTEAIDALVNNVKQLLEFLSKVDDIRPFIMTLFKPPLRSKRTKVTQRNFEYIWYYEGLKEYVLELIRTLIGMVPYYEADRVKLRIR